MHPIAENRISFSADSSFTYIGHVPSVFLSEDWWKYNSTTKEIAFVSKRSNQKFIDSITVDTLWVNISNKKALFVTKNRLLFDGITYYEK